MYIYSANIVKNIDLCKRLTHNSRQAHHVIVLNSNAQHDYISSQKTDGDAVVSGPNASPSKP